jgi:hypothetical protein
MPIQDLDGLIDRFNRIGASADFHDITGKIYYQR